MTIRTLKRDDTIHIVNIGCIVLALGVTSYYFDAKVVDRTMATLGNLLLTPVFITDYFLEVATGAGILGSKFKMFLVLWISFFLTIYRLSNILIVTDHQSSELKNWYQNKFKS